MTARCVCIPNTVCFVSGWISLLTQLLGGGQKNIVSRQHKLKSAGQRSIELRLLCLQSRHSVVELPLSLALSI